jgi:serine/threonine-protein kinase
LSRKNTNIRARQRIGKYRVQRRLARGGFAEVWMAHDTIEGIPVAIKIPHDHLIDADTLELFRKEVRLTAQLDHPNILPIKTASFEGGHFLIVYPLGEGNLEDRLSRRSSVRTVVDWIEQLLEALAYAHERNIIHCDVKPENIILFDKNRLRLADFGIAKVAQKTLRADGTGTIGFTAPEQAMGRPSLRSDVFSAGIVIYRMLTGEMPEWPFKWPFPGLERIRGKVHPDLIAFVRRATEVDARSRFEDARHMLETFQRMKKRVLGAVTRRTTRRRGAKSSTTRDWKVMRIRQFKREYGRALETKSACSNCSGPVSEAMRHCPWCGDERRTHRGTVRFPSSCPRCKRGVKSDWRFCAWCYGGLIGPLTERTYSDTRYTTRCTAPGCVRRELMPFMRYCPWCNTKVRREWRIEESNARCQRCKWGIVREFWDWCPWCGTGTS